MKYHPIQPHITIPGLWGCVAAISAIALAPHIAYASTQMSKNNPISQAESSAQWRRMTEDEVTAQWDNILSNPLGIAALNQLAIEGFINPSCEKSFFVNDQYGGFQTLLRVQCPESHGVSSAVEYDEMRVIFNRFESTIENFEVQRIADEQAPGILLPE